MEASVYSCVDVQDCLNSLDMKKLSEKRMVLESVSGYLFKSEQGKGRMCVNSRSCKLIGFSHQLTLQLEHHSHWEKKISVVACIARRFRSRS